MLVPPVEHVVCRASKCSGSLVPWGSERTTGSALPTMDKTFPMPCLAGGDWVHFR